MKKSYLFLYVIFMLTNGACFAQISDDFSTMNFLLDNQVRGDVEKFKVEDGALKLNASGTESAYLALPYGSNLDTIEWQWTVNHQFASSNNNYSRIYLWANRSNLPSSSCNAFYLQLGENGSSDAIELFYQQGSVVRSVCRGANARIAEPFKLKIRVLNCRGNQWIISVFEDDIWMLDAMGEMEIPKTDSSYTGLLVKYTSSNIAKFSYDDFYCGPALHDTVPPCLLSVSKCSQSYALQLSFSERLDTNHIDKSHFFLNDLQINSVYCTNNQKDIIIEFEQDIKQRCNYSLVISSISDLSGNVLLDTIVQFVDYYPLRNDVVFTEIMSDPSPVVGLPEGEYLELYNRSPFPINLSQWSIAFGNSVKLLPEILLNRDSYLLLVAQNCVDLFADYDNVISISSFSIPNEGQQLVLMADNGSVVHELEFSSEWHSQQLKAEGGWSLEMIDTDNPCAGKSNWDSSIDSKGGTPGFKNSISRLNRDETAPELLYVVALDSITLNIFFSETIDLDTSQFSSLFHFNHDLMVKSVDILSPKANSLLLTLSTPLRVGTVYTLQLVGEVCDCVGLPVKTWSSAQFGLLQKISINDVIINEILTHTFGNADADFVELYNRSDKLVNIADLQIAYETSNGKLTAVEAFKYGYPLFPHTFVVLCKDRENTMSQYFCPTPSNLLTCPSMPNFPNSQGTIVLMNKALEVIDRFSYDESMHYSILTDLAGVSLERIHYDWETQNENNWKSASANVGFATPGYTNSQHSDVTDELSSLFSVSPEIFSPDGDGFDDFTEICCHFDAGNYRLSLQIFNSQGHLIKVLADNMPIGLNECFTWDGSINDGSSAVRGGYILRFTYWNESGKRKSVNKFVGVTYRK